VVVDKVEKNKYIEKLLKLEGIIRGDYTFSFELY